MTKRSPVIRNQCNYFCYVTKRWRVRGDADVSITQDCYPRQEMVKHRKLYRKQAMKQLVAKRDKRAYLKRATQSRIAEAMEKTLLGETT